MRRSTFVNLMALALILSIGSLGCKHKPVGLTPIPGQKPAVAGPPPAPPVTTPPPVSTAPPVGPAAPTQGGNLPPGENPLPGLETFDGMPANREVFKEFTVYFDFDRSELKTGERHKVESVADYLKKAAATNKLLIEGHCDERGTEEYNRSLGERRALALREYLLNLGIDSNRIRTISYGKDRPVDPGHTDEAWAKNRRGVFVLLLPKTEAK